APPQSGRRRGGARASRPRLQRVEDGDNLQILERLPMLYDRQVLEQVEPLSDPHVFAALQRERRWNQDRGRDRRHARRHYTPERPAQPADERLAAAVRVQRHHRGEARARLARRQRRDQGGGGGEEIALLAALRTGGEMGVGLLPLG